MPVKYARFHMPVPPFKDAEPVSEFKVDATGKYAVESMSLGVHGLTFTAKGEKGIIPLANVVYVRPA